MLHARDPCAVQVKDGDLRPLAVQVHVCGVSVVRGVHLTARAARVVAPIVMQLPDHYAVRPFGEPTARLVFISYCLFHVVHWLVQPGVWSRERLFAAMAGVGPAKSCAFTVAQATVQSAAPCGFMAKAPRMGRIAGLTKDVEKAPCRLHRQCGARINTIIIMEKKAVQVTLLRHPRSGALFF